MTPRPYSFPRNCEAILIGCGADKSAVASPAMDLYTSQFFAAKRTFVRSTGMPWAILSAKHALLHADSIVEPYNLSADTFTKWQKREWALRAAGQLLEWQRYIQCVAIIAGAHYMHPLEEILMALGVQVVNPCKGLGIGEQIAWLNKAAAWRP